MRTPRRIGCLILPQLTETLIPELAILGSRPATGLY